VPRSGVAEGCWVSRNGDRTSRISRREPPLVASESRGLAGALAELLTREGYDVQLIQSRDRAAATGDHANPDGVAVILIGARSESSSAAIPTDLQPANGHGDISADHVDRPANTAAAGRCFGFLTNREQQVLAALMDAVPAVEIARTSFMSEATVRHHIRSILMKLNVNSQLAAVVAAYRAGWKPPRRGSLRAVGPDTRAACH
jgi:DNA-binding NarL/FixJ family response regulator